MSERNGELLSAIKTAGEAALRLYAENAALRQRVAELERDGEHYDCNVAILTQQRDAAENAALRKDAERYRDDAREYHRVMGWLRATKMQHGLCQPRERRACTHCNAVDNLEDAITAYRGPPIILAATMEQSP